MPRGNRGVCRVPRSDVWPQPVPFHMPVRDALSPGPEMIAGDSSPFYPLISHAVSTLCSVGIDPPLSPSVLPTLLFCWPDSLRGVTPGKSACDRGYGRCGACPWNTHRRNSTARPRVQDS